MNLKKELTRNDIDYRFEEYDYDVYLYKIAGKINLVHMIGKTNIFSLDRDLFYYLDNQKLPYYFLLEETEDANYYFLEFVKKINWLSSCFNSCDKESLFFGKQVLNNRINKLDIIKRIKRILQ